MSADSNEIVVTITVVQSDTVAPVITITTPAAGAPYVLRSSVLANYSCADPAPGAGLASCVGSVANGAALDTGTVGPKTFTVTATDVAGNSTTAVRSYLVVYAFTLSSLKSPARLGSAVPVNWQLKDALGASIQSLTTLTTIESVFNGAAPRGGCVASTAGVRHVLYSPATGATGGSDFRLVSGGYQFNWDTSTAQGTGAGCYTVLITLNDGSAPKMSTPVLVR
jgi:hypothetical protein